ncbi:glycogen synthase [uncultured Nitrospira sp.]|uniref:glycogen synthase n=1 Tax=uncultured Nitrospira sp. TaxID=157176 RepID=UPI00313FEB7F
MKALMFTNEFPPYTYGGAGAHVEYLSRELSHLLPVEVRCFGDQHLEQGNLKVEGIPLGETPFAAPKPLHSVLGAVQRCWQMNADGLGADLIHCHTWYTHLGGIMAKLNYGIPLVITTHSLEPLRPWKREQLAGGYDFSLWVEKTALEMADAIIAVSEGTKKDILKLFQVPEERIHVIHNGIDLQEFRKVQSQEVLIRYGIPTGQPYVLFVGRMTRQKGITYLIQALSYLDEEFPVVLCASSPDTPAIAAEMKEALDQISAHRKHIYWIPDILDKPSLIELYSHAGVFCCPSIYEPFGIINLEAMACEVPVVASAVGGIPEVVVEDETGFLVPVDQFEEAPFSPKDPERFAQDLADRLNQLMRDSELRVPMGQAGRRRAEELFGWDKIAKRTKALYETVLEAS